MKLLNKHFGPLWTEGGPVARIRKLMKACRLANCLFTKKTLNIHSLGVPLNSSSFGHLYNGEVCER